MSTLPPSPIPLLTSRENGIEILSPAVARKEGAPLTSSRSSSPSASSSRASSLSPDPSPLPSPAPSSPCMVPTFKREKEQLHRLMKKRRTTHARWSILAVPFVLALITLSTRYLSHPAVLDFLSHEHYSVNSWQALAASLTDWHAEAHGRHEKRASYGSSQEMVEISSTDSFTLVSTSATPASESASSSTSASSTSLVSTSPTSSSSPGDTTVPTIPASSPVLPTPFPQPFDTTLSPNFSTQSCYTFFQNMTQTESFRDCRPFSLLVAQSTAFIEAQNNLTLLNNVLWGTCNTGPSLDQCTANMDWFAQELQTACAIDLKANNELAASTLVGLHAYSLMRATACLPANTTNTYCYIDAVANSGSADAYFYELPLGLSVPNGTTPSCSMCIQDVMAVYVEEGLGTADLGTTYAHAAAVADTACGNGFVQAVESQSKSGGSPVAPVAQAAAWALALSVMSAAWAW
ncbi:hypothetical protein WOLCODRAFT_139891 [Wolfiporia cocos MD-104 SS10]|uniref:DUF7729 domain-containing protein n=1 Tax=Wolfiporia cocos (strain MD-104) TaxID=742152 RepID=A0A2H3IZI4_WOLCO|nr:hypothetical protein WOLCODRAFT_139891 [Wolfiporia cocos MD-104 SS10]